MMARHSKQGFTLIEILIVMLIISVVSGVAIISISRHQNARFEDVAKQITNTLTMAEEQALLQASVLGLNFTDKNFQVYQFQTPTTPTQNPWQPVQDAIFALHNLPDDMRVSISVGGKAMPLTTNQPQLIIATSGDIIPFIILLSKANGEPRYKIVGDADGSITRAAFHG